MTAETRLERNLPVILDDLSAGPAPDYFDDVFARTGRMRQRPGWTFPGRWLPMADITRSRAFAPAPPWWLIAVALVLITLVLAALFAFAGSQRHVAPPFGPARNGVLVFESAGDLYIGDPVTGKTRLLVGGPEADSSPGFSLDGTRVAFYREATCCPGKVHIWTVNADGSDLHQVTTEPTTTDHWANWAPDSRHLGVITVANGPGRLELLDADGTEPPRILATDTDIESVTFRPPDGKEIAYRAVVGGHYGVYAIGTDGTNPRTILEPTVQLDMGDHAANMVFSADGKRLFYQSYAPAGDGFSGGCCQLRVVNADGTNDHRFEAALPQAWTGLPSVSPDGRWVAYWSVLGSSGNQQIRVAPADESGPSIGTGPAMSDFFPWAWSPDSSKILMYPDDGSTTSAYLIDPEGGPFDKVPFDSGAALDWQRQAP
jgi:Tol biopolymer transport system component